MKCMQVFVGSMLLLGVCLLGVSACGAEGGPADLPKRMRGISTSEQYLTADLVEFMAQANANVIRIGFSVDSGFADPPTVDNPLAPYETNLAILDAALPIARAAGIKIIICAAEVYGYELDYTWKTSSNIALFSDHLAAFWGAMAKRYLNEPAIVAYDILNEPSYPTGSDGAWYGKVLPAAVAAIRGVNPSIWLVVEPGPWGLPDGLKRVRPLADPYVIYSFHPYVPHSYCQQGIGGYVGYSAAYPGTNSMWGDAKSSTYWDKGVLRKNMQAAIDFSRKYKVRILVGEFGVLRWAPGAEKWIADMVSIFEEQGWDWCYHSVGGWNGFSPTYDADDQSTSQEPDGGDRGPRWQVLSNGWSLNRLDDAQSTQGVE